MSLCPRNSQEASALSRSATFLVPLAQIIAGVLFVTIDDLIMTLLGLFLVGVGVYFMGVQVKDVACCLRARRHAEKNDPSQQPLPRCF